MASRSIAVRASFLYSGFPLAVYISASVFLYSGFPLAVHRFCMAVFRWPCISATVFLYGGFPLAMYQCIQHGIVSRVNVA